jgi:hypothetical protein
MIDKAWTSLGGLVVSLWMMVGVAMMVKDKAKEDNNPT